MIKNNTDLKLKIKENITNLVNLGVIPAEEAQLNLNVIYNSILNEFCSVVPMESPRQIISCLKLKYDSQNKSMIENKDAFSRALMNGFTVPFNDNGYPTDDVKCTLVPDTDKIYLADYQNIIPGTISINHQNMIDDSNGSIINSETNDVLGTVDYRIGKFTFTEEIPANITLSYKFDIYNLNTNKNLIKFTKEYVEIFAQLFQLDANVAMSLIDVKQLDLKAKIESILPQTLTQQIDQYVINKYFKLATEHKVGEWSSAVDWNTTTRTPVHLLYSDLGAFINIKTADYVEENGVVPNVLLVSPKGYGILSTSEKFKATNIDDFTGTPKVVGYYNNQKVILTNVIDSTVDIVLTYKGDAEAQSAGVFAPYIPVTLRSVQGLDDYQSGLILNNTVYSINGFAMINPNLVKGIKIID